MLIVDKILSLNAFEIFLLQSIIPGIAARCTMLSILNFDSFFFKSRTF